MPHYRIHIKLEGEPVKEYLVNDCRNYVDDVYLDYRKRVNEKNGAGRVIYFDLVMLSEHSLLHLEERKEVFHEANDFGISIIGPAKKPANRKKEYGNATFTLGDRVRT